MVTAYHPSLDFLKTLFHNEIKQAQCATALDQWYRLGKKADWNNFPEICARFPSTDKVADLFAFDIGGMAQRFGVSAALFL